MTISEIEKLVFAAESEIQGIQGRAEQIVDDIKKSMPSHLKDMAKKIVSNTIEQNPKGVLDLGEKVNDLKKQIENALISFENEISAKLDSNIKWAHKQSIREEETYRLKDALTKETIMSVTNVGCVILGKVGSLLIENKLTVINNSSYWKIGDGNKVMFSYGMEFYHYSEKTKFIKDIERYISIIDEYIKAQKKLNTARDNKDKAEARKFWDEG